MTKKVYSHKVTLSDRRRENKKAKDMLRKDTSVEPLFQVFNTYYRDQVRALYKTVTRGK